jgi:hypothetical protein
VKNGVARIRPLAELKGTCIKVRPFGHTPTSGGLWPSRAQVIAGGEGGAGGIKSRIPGVYYNFGGVPSLDPRPIKTEGRQSSWCVRGRGRVRLCLCVDEGKSRRRAPGQMKLLSRTCLPKCKLGPLRGIPEADCSSPPAIT